MVTVERSKSGLNLIPWNSSFSIICLWEGSNISSCPICFSYFFSLSFGK